MTILSVFIILLTAIYVRVRQQYKRKALLHFHDNSGYANAPQSVYPTVLCQVVALLMNDKWEMGKTELVKNAR